MIFKQKFKRFEVKSPKENKSLQHFNERGKQKSFKVS